jgi:hypothetical protein
LITGHYPSRYTFPLRMEPSEALIRTPNLAFNSQGFFSPQILAI